MRRLTSAGRPSHLGAWAMVALFPGGCGRSSSAVPPAEASAPAVAATAVASGSAAGSEPTRATGLSWPDAIRGGEWQKAAELIDGLGEEARARAEVRFARARVAIALSDHARAVKELEGLEEKLPVVRVEIARHRAESQLEAGPYSEAAEYFAARGDARSLVSAAKAFERSGDLNKARAAADRAVVASRVLTKKDRKRGRLPETEARARSTRAAIAEKLGQTAVAKADLRWVATMAPTADVAKGLEARIERVAPTTKLSTRQRYDRAMSFAREGLIEQTEHELAAIDDAPGPRVAEAERLHARGWARYMARSDYREAAELLREAATKGAKHKVRNLFYAARALSRAHEDAKAIVEYDALAKKYPNSSFAERARYLSARLHYISGSWKSAISGYERYLKRHAKRGGHAGSARYELAVSLLAAGRHSQAAKALGDLAKGADSPRETARLAQLEGLAHDLAGKTDVATKRYQSVIRDRPLSFAALASSARLAKLGTSAPPLIEPAKSDAKPPELEVKLPAKAQLLSNIGLDLEAEDELALHEDRIRKAFAPRGDEALCAAYGKLDVAARLYRIGQRAVRWQALAEAPSGRTRWTWECIYPRPHSTLVQGAAAEYELAEELVYAVMRQESAFQPDVVSPARAVGLMQLIPPTARSVANELDVAYDPLLLTTPAYNIRFGSYYLKKVLDTFGGRVELAAAAYNAGPGAVSRWLETGENLPTDLWVARIPYGETRGYVSRVVGNVARYAYLSGGEQSVPKLELELPKGLRAKKDAY